MPATNASTGSADSGSLTAAEANINQFVDDVLTRQPANVVDTRVTAVAREDTGDRVRFTVVFQLADGQDVTFEVAMPDLPLARVNYGARENDRPWGFPRLRVNRDDRLSRLWWRFAVELVVLTLTQAEAKVETHRALGPLYEVTSNQRSEGGLGWGYDPGLPDEPFTAAWGCRAIIHQGGSVDVLPDRQSSRGDDKAIDALIDKLNGGLNAKWKATVVDMLRGYEMSTGLAKEFTLLDEDGVVVKANTNGSGGYLYVCAYTSEQP